MACDLTGSWLYVSILQSPSLCNAIQITGPCLLAIKNVRISIKISLKFVPKGPINNNPVLVQIMAWRRPGHKPLSEPMMVCLLMHIWITRPQWVNIFIANTGDVWSIPSVRIWGYVLHVEHISLNCGQHQWVTPSPLSVATYALLEVNITRKLLSLSLDLFFKVLLFRVIFLYSFLLLSFFLTFFRVVCFAV